MLEIVADAVVERISESVVVKLESLEKDKLVDIVVVKFGEIDEENDGEKDG